MFFFEDFIKNLDKIQSNREEFQKYGVEFSKIVIWLGTGIPLILLGMLQIYTGYLKNNNLIYILIGCGLIFLGLKHIKTIFSYKIILNLKEGNLKFQQIKIDFSEIDRCYLKEAVVGKRGKLQIILRVITKDKKEIIIPLIMQKKKVFIATIREILKDRFEVEC